MEERLRTLPSVDEVLSRLDRLRSRFPRPVIAGEVRRAIESARAAIRAGSEPPDDLESRIVESLEALESPSQRSVINATGVVLHTNLGRAPLACFHPEFGYTNLEYDLGAGKRGKRDVHTGGLLERLTGHPGIAVNNNAAAVYLALHELAAGYEVVVSRGELIEIGDGFRIPDIMAQSGAVLREVGTTNRTHLDDYRSAINERTRLILRVHPSNFEIRGFAGKPALEELAALAREKSIPLYEDLGSGCMADLSAYGVNEPLVQASLAARAALVSFSGDKLLGGPQAGILCGRADLVARLRRNPMYRALRVDKLILQSLEASLRNLLLERWECVPALRMIRMPAEEIRRRARYVVSQLAGIEAEIVAGESVIGGGSTPEQSIPTWLIALSTAAVNAVERRLRQANPPVVARIEHERLMLDLRTVFPEQEPALVAALKDALALPRR